MPVVGTCIKGICVPWLQTAVCSNTELHFAPQQGLHSWDVGCAVKSTATTSYEVIKLRSYGMRTSDSHKGCLTMAWYVAASGEK